MIIGYQQTRAEPDSFSQDPHVSPQQSNDVMLHGHRFYAENRRFVVCGQSILWLLWGRIRLSAGQLFNPARSHFGRE